MIYVFLLHSGKYGKDKDFQQYLLWEISVSNTSPTVSSTSALVSEASVSPSLCEEELLSPVDDPPSVNSLELANDICVSVSSEEDEDGVRFRFFPGPDLAAGGFVFSVVSWRGCRAFFFRGVTIRFCSITSRSSLSCSTLSEDRVRDHMASPGGEAMPCCAPPIGVGDTPRMPKNISHSSNNV